MWQLSNLTPFAADRGWIRDRDGAEVWQVAVRASFNILPTGRCELADEQSPVCHAPVFETTPSGMLLLRDTDFPLSRRSTDLIVVADAYAPRGRATPSVDVALRAATLDKVLRVWGDRTARRDGSPDAATPFVRMPVTYTRALGGPDPLDNSGEVDPVTESNPVGIGFARRTSTLANRPLPNIEYPSLRARDAAQGAPAGLAPIAPGWWSRLRYAGTYDAAWERDQAPLLPTDLDDRFFQCAPPDQQSGELWRGSEPVQLTNMTESGLLSFAVPRVELRAEARFAKESVAMPFQLMAVLIDARASRVELSFGARLRCHAQVHELDRTIVRWKPVVRLHTLGRRPPRPSGAIA